MRAINCICGKPVVVEWLGLADTRGEIFQVNCHHCGRKSPTGTRDQAVERWNKIMAVAEAAKEKL